MLAKALAVDLDQDRIRVNCVCPSVVDTSMSRADLGLVEEGFDDQPYRVHRPEDIARSILFLASPVSAGINGTTEVLDFGGPARSTFPACPGVTSHHTSIVWAQMNCSFLSETRSLT